MPPVPAGAKLIGGNDAPEPWPAVTLPATLIIGPMTLVPVTEASMFLFAISPPWKVPFLMSMLWPAATWGWPQHPAPSPLATITSAVVLGFHEAASHVALAHMNVLLSIAKVPDRTIVPTPE